MAVAETPEEENDTGSLELTKRRSRPSYDRDWTRGSIIGNLWSLSWPMTISTAIRMMGPTIDMIWIGSLGTAAIAGVGVSGMAVQAINAAKMGLNTGTRAMLARFVGGGNSQGANHVAQQALAISLAFSVAMAAVGVFLAEPLLVFLGVEADVVREGAAYMRILFCGAVFMSLGMMAQSIMQASGDAVNPMKVNIGIRLFHVLLCPFLVYGWWIFPYMGVKGAATTNVISQMIGSAIMFWLLFTGRTRLRMTLKGFRLDWRMIWRIIRIGIPASITGMERNLANFLLMWFVVPFGTSSVAAHALSDRIDNLVHMPAQGLGQASGVLAGQNLGAGRPNRSEQTGWTAAGLFTAVMAVASVGIWFWAEYVVRLFNSEPEMVAITSTFLRIDIVNYMVFGIVIVMMHCLNGMGDTMVPMLTTLVTMWLVQVPVAYILPQVTDIGVYGIRWAIVTGIAMRAVTYAIYFKHGRWRRLEI